MTIAIPATPAPAPIPAFAPVERPSVAGCTGYWIAKTIFTIADVGFCVDVDDRSSVLEVVFRLAVIGMDIGVWEVTGTAGGTR